MEISIIPGPIQQSSIQIPQQQQQSFQYPVYQYPPATPQYYTQPNSVQQQQQHHQQQQSFGMQNMSLADRDNYLAQIEQQIQAKRNLLLSKRHFLDNTIKQNQFLAGIKNDYTKYYDYISKKRREELAAMSILKQYTDDLIASNKMTESGISQSKHDQLSILDEMKKIQSALDEIIGTQQQQLK
jgi:hypothetical protein